jgi:DNA-directed RNA polymerase subunit RPC12/RpoP
MAEIKFSCPHCGQNIQCDPQWGGQQIACPACSNNLIVPRLASIVAPAPAASRPQPASQPQVAVRAANAAPKSSKTIIAWSVGAAACLVLLLFGGKLVDKWQGSFNKKATEMAAKGGEGEMAHIGRLYQALDATDPARMEEARMRATRRAEKERATMLEDLKPKPDATLAMPIVPATWTMDPAAATIPKGRVNGGSGGTDFHVETVQLTRSPTASVLSFQEGTGTTTVHEMFVYLPVKPAEDLAGRSWSVTKETKSKDAPQIVRRWTVNPKYMPSEKTYSKGYIMKLELDQPTRDWQPGRIYLALPDTNQTVLAGEFSIPIPRKADFEMP